MTTGARNFFIATVKPTVDEFFGAQLDIRRGRLAAIVLFHMADYWDLETTPNANDTTLKRLHAQLIQACPDFALIKDVANASKHDRLTRGTPQLSESDQITRTLGIFGPLNTAACNEPSMVIVTLDNRTSRPLIVIVRSALSMWETMLQ